MRTTTIIGVLLAGGLALTGCMPSESPSEVPPAPGTPPPEPPGQHGNEPVPQHGGLGQAPAHDALSQGAEHSSTDREFAQQLVAHHTQTAELVALAKHNSQNAQIGAFASRVERTQQPHREQAEQWSATALGTESGSAPEDVADQQLPVPGLQPPETLAKLRSAQGADFDRQWVQVMTTHLDGALRIAQSEQEEGQAQRMRDLAEQVVATGLADLTRLKSLSV